jgi:hypothetical protein
MTRKVLIAAALLASSACAFAADSPAPAAAPAPVRVVREPPRGVNGTVVSVAGDTVVLRTKEGAEATVSMTAGWTLSIPRAATAAELRLGDFIGSASVDTGTDHGRANEVRIFEAGYRPEYGTHAIAAAGTSMTHGFVFALRKVEGGTEMEIAYPDGRRTILVPEGMTVTVSDLKERSVLTPGVAVSAVTRRGPDNVWRASRLTLVKAN